MTASTITSLTSVGLPFIIRDGEDFGLRLWRIESLWTLIYRWVNFFLIYQHHGSRCLFLLWNFHVTLSLVVRVQPLEHWNGIIFPASSRTQHFNYFFSLTVRVPTDGPQTLNFRALTWKLSSNFDSSFFNSCHSFFFFLFLFLLFKHFPLHCYRKIILHP